MGKSDKFLSPKFAQKKKTFTVPVNCLQNNHDPSCCLSCFLKFVEFLKTILPSNIINSPQFLVMAKAIYTNVIDLNKDCKTNTNLTLFYNEDNPVNLPNPEWM